VQCNTKAASDYFVLIFLFCACVCDSVVTSSVCPCYTQTAGGIQLSPKPKSPLSQASIGQSQTHEGREAMGQQVPPRRAMPAVPFPALSLCHARACRRMRRGWRGSRCAAGAPALLPCLFNSFSSTAKDSLGWRLLYCCFFLILFCGCY